MSHEARTPFRARRIAFAFAVCAAFTVAAPWSAPIASAADPGPALLVAVDAQDMGTFDRVTFTFRSAPTDAIPMIRRAEYVDRPVLEDASGKEIDVTGNAILRIAMSPAATIDVSVDPPVTTYTGPARIQPDLPSVVDIVKAGEFESVLSWVIGLRSGAATVTAQVLSDPTRVVVDIPHVTVTAVLAAPSFTG